jgi:hypothetical protein
LPAEYIVIYHFTAVLKLAAKLQDMVFITDLEILVVLITRLLKQDLNRLVNEIELVKLWDKG